METQSVEYKQIWRDDFLKEICGFANAQGGTLYIGIADNGDVVRVENPHIAATFFRAGEVEAWGQGIERVQSYCTDYGCPVPEWRFDGAGIWTVFYYKTQTESSGKSEQKSREKSTLKTREKSTLKSREKSGLKAEQSPENHTESTLKTMEKNTKKTMEKTREKSTLKGTLKIVMEIIASNPDITLDKIAEQLGKNPRGIDKHIKNLREQGLIRRIGPDKGGHWEITNQ
ncbi:MAG: putative DNA binding domain-containing protein [Paludibacteraceae bacterium]|nr:putative DNA binding domain-containing protein [Paludibacteraceae bacterium]